MRITDFLLSAPANKRHRGEVRFCCCMGGGACLCTCVYLFVHVCKGEGEGGSGRAGGIRTDVTTPVVHSAHLHAAPFSVADRLRRPDGQ